jgi:hypothetical protein
MGSYPTGPEAVAREDALIQSLTDPVFIVLWVYAASVVGVILLWTAFRAVRYASIVNPMNMTHSRYVEHTCIYNKATGIELTVDSWVLVF